MSKLDTDTDNVVVDGSSVAAVAEPLNFDGGIDGAGESSDSADLPVKMHQGHVRSDVLAVTHVMYDGWEGCQDDLANMRHVYRVAFRLGKSLGIESLDRPYSLEYLDGKVPEDSGVSAVWLFPGGHMAIHTFDKRGFVFVDVSMMDHEGDDVLVAVKNAMRVGFDTQKDETFLRGTNKVSDPNVISATFGPHLTFQGQLTPEQMSMDWFYELLESVPQEIGMTAISTPTVIKPKRMDGRRGWDGVAIIAESHIALHADPDGRFYFDAFSCKAFDTDAFLALVKSKGLRIDQSSIALTARGKNFPRAQAQRTDERRG